MENMKCPKCAGNMIQGNYSGNIVDWQTDPSKSFLKTEGKEILTYACNMCGYMESYVRKQ